MSKTKFFLTILTILIAVVPMTTYVIIYRENPVDLILPNSLAELFMGSIDDLATVDNIHFAGMYFSFPTLVGDPVLHQNGTLNLIYKFTNPLDGQITINAINAEIVCLDHDYTLGHVFIEPATLEPNQTLEFNVTGVLTPQAIEHITTQHNKQNSINTEFKNFSVDLTGIKITMPHRKLGDIQLPHAIFASNSLLYR